MTLSQDRATIFNTGVPEDVTVGHLISSSQSIANKFYTNNDYVLETLIFSMSMISESANLIISIRHDDNGFPGELVNELSTWNYSLNPNNQSETGNNIISTTNLCIYLDAGNAYWWRIDAADDETEAIWSYSPNELYTYGSYSEIDEEWSIFLGNAGSGAIFAEQIFQPYNDGDINTDFIINVVDIVALVSYVMGTEEIDDDTINLADLNNDGIINVVDIVALVSKILEDKDANPNFLIEDINPASEYFGQNLGPSYFNGDVSCYYFGKQG
tara:strand:- start:516 stop:1328 length:813 start_codon:yes stop_codon:yes gene_type:complete